jgi:hypothetical protein
MEQLRLKSVYMYAVLMLFHSGILTVRFIPIGLMSEGAPRASVSGLWLHLYHSELVLSEAGDCSIVLLIARIKASP